MQLDGPKRKPLAGETRAAVVLLHGYGADGHDLIGLADTWAEALPYALFVAPHAPQELPFVGFGGRQWFPLTSRDPAEYAAGAAAAAPALHAFLDCLQQAHELASASVVLVGFSQGCMMALQVGLRRPAPLAGIIGYSGMIAAPASLPAELTSPAPVLLVHGTHDEVIPVQALDFTRGVLVSAGLDVTAHARPGLGHGIDDDGLQLGADFLRRHLPPAARGV